MPRSLPFILLAFLLFAGRVGAQFGPGNTVYPFGGSAKMQGADLDGDGDQDLFGVFNGRHLKWFENLDGNGDMGPAVAIASFGDDIALHVLADTDDDQDIDVVLVKEGHNTVYVLRNDGTGGFDGVVPILNTPQEPGAIAVRDINGDGIPDLVMTLGNVGDAGFGWCAGSSSGFGPLTEVLGLHDGGRSDLLIIGDIDLIGGVDMVLHAQGDDLVLVRNNQGDASDWQPSPLPIAPQPPSYPYQSPMLIDVDGDGDLDLAESRGPAVHWLRNDLDEGGALEFSENLVEPWTAGGSGVFGASPCGGAAVVFVPSDPQLPVRWNTYVELLNGFPYSSDLPTLPRGQDLRLVDLDGDGKLDLVMALANGVQWFKNSAAPSTLTLDLPVLDTLCLAGPAVPLPDASPSGGRWYGQHVFDQQLFRGNVFVPALLPLTHVVYSPEGCPLAESGSIRLIDRPTILTTIPDVLCSADEPIELASDPVQVQWFGTVGGNILDPSVFTGGFVVCQYTDPTGSMCGNLRGPILRWNSLPATIAPAGPFCANDPVQQITASAIPPSGGTWSGDISGATPLSATFDPSLGPGEYEVILNVQPTGQGQCANSDTIRIVVGERPTITFTPFPAYCANGDQIVLGGVTPTNGVWSGPGVTDGLLDPAVAGIGTHLLSYFAASAEGCARQAATSIQLVDAVNLNWNAPDLDLCPLDAPVTILASPVGGVWSSPIDENGTIDPALFSPGTYPVEYTYTDPVGCVLSNEDLEFSVGVASEISMDLVGTICVTAAPITIQGSASGTWSGAISGQGTSIVLDPAILGPGTWEVTLTAAVGDECPGTVTQEIVVDVCSGINDPSSNSSILAPNPFTDLTVVRSTTSGWAVIEVLDGAGRMISSTSGEIGKDHGIPLDLSSEAPGMYLVRVLQSGTTVHHRAVKTQ